MRTITSAAQPLSPEEEAVVRAFGRAILVIPRAIDADMVRTQRPPLSEYAALMHLSEAPQRRMRMSELSAACDLPSSGMTRLVTRLEADGLIQRVRCEKDARGAVRGAHRRRPDPSGAGVPEAPGERPPAHRGSSARARSCSARHRSPATRSGRPAVFVDLTARVRVCGQASPRSRTPA